MLFKFLFIVLFYRQFRICFTNASGCAHTPKVARVLRLSLWTPAIAGERAIYGVKFLRHLATHYFSLVVLAPFCPLRRLRRHLSQRERLLFSSIISQIGRENKFSAEILCLRILRLEYHANCSAVFCLKYFYESLLQCFQRCIESTYAKRFVTRYRSDPFHPCFFERQTAK